MTITRSAYRWSIRDNAYRWAVTFSRLERIGRFCTWEFSLSCSRAVGITAYTLVLWRLRLAVLMQAARYPKAHS